MERLLRFLRAKRSFEVVVYLLFSFSFVYGVVTGKIFFFGRSDVFTATISEAPWWYWSIMAFSAFCVLGLYATIRAWLRNKGRWFRE
jgi:hypothetical protein